ncbi:phosphopantetheine-binding protein [Streptomyces sp. ALI-76-A]|uniref:phosphopantetheine-binding protein n=1 Tax=Streptomyces sp. ALI-76-A TaxID=3025736 RepID=UPI00256F18B0|nr:phosphopantetheine-binding protein [Streptomyces sp. ALI-76-A]MDL5205905.1 phosphopantetheine-binding protein [Streptomyces sp. ALI-76-A]
MSLHEDGRRPLSGAQVGLHRLTGDHPAGSFVTFSAVNGCFGGAVNAAHAAVTGVSDAWTPRSAGSTAHQDQSAPGDSPRRLETWCGVLGRDRVRRDDDFSDLGGDTPPLVTAQPAVTSAFGTGPPVVDLFTHPTARPRRHLSTPAGAGTTSAARPTPPGECAGQGAVGPAVQRSAEAATSGQDRTKEQAPRQRAARARRIARHGKDRGHA